MSFYYIFSNNGKLLINTLILINSYLNYIISTFTLFHSTCFLILSTSSYFIIASLYISIYLTFPFSPYALICLIHLSLSSLHNLSFILLFLILTRLFVIQFQTSSDVIIRLFTNSFTQLADTFNPPVLYPISLIFIFSESFFPFLIFLNLSVFVLDLKCISLRILFILSFLYSCSLLYCPSSILSFVLARSVKCSSPPTKHKKGITLSASLRYYRHKNIFYKPMFPIHSSIWMKL